MHIYQLLSWCCLGNSFWVFVVWLGTTQFNSNNRFFRSEMKLKTFATRHSCIICILAYSNRNLVAPGVRVTSLQSHDELSRECEKNAVLFCAEVTSQMVKTQRRTQWFWLNFPASNPKKGVYLGLFIKIQILGPLRVVPSATSGENKTLEFVVPYSAN